MYKRVPDYDSKTTIEITLHVWKQLNALKGPGDSFNTVIQRILESRDEARRLTK